ncbi:hypothetical protein [Fluviispira sanaruensis]|uniref:Transglycosylase SLT domain-containing protein n=1 Tax=Fluviispira sanaruensis TaxID=2493639 RepID=A0A4P2VJG1_FLUSA|nr:hypothetical protein [Fluviispira sanaruensis]BBH51700.1 hypothetical protein JCM31447_01170 [Fluviispira sanaruensis]
MSYILVSQTKESLIKHALILLFAVLSVSCSTTFLASDKLNQKQKQDFKMNLEELFKNKMIQEDLDIATTTYQVLSAFEEIKDSKFEFANRISKDLLYTKGLSNSIYKFAFKAYSISSILLLNEKISNKNMSNDIDFFSFQNNQCEILCDSYGWKSLARDDSSLFTPEGYKEEILSDDFFAFVNKQKPEWISESIYLDQHVAAYNSYIKNLIKNENSSVSDLHLEKLEDQSSIDKEEVDALFSFVNGEFTKSKTIFLSLAEKSSNPQERAIYYYWIGRAYTAEKKNEDARKYFVKSGIENPLSLYDALSGQMIKNPSGRSSTNELSPFPDSWEKEMEKWVTYPSIISNSNIIKTLKAAIILASKIKIEKNILRLDEYQDFIVKNENIETLLLKDEINWLTKNWLKEFKNWPKNEKPDIIGNNIAWLLFITGQNVQSIMFVSQIKDTLDPFSDNNNFLYFLFYPRLYKEEVSFAIKQCPVDPDLVYAVLRQEVFYNQNTESKDSILRKTCSLKANLANYRNGIVTSLSGYHVGEELTDEWIKYRAKINDDAIFMETIPDEKAKDFIKETVKNYYNIKWIYFKKDSISETLMNLFFAFER